MNKLIKWAIKYWAVISVAATIVSSVITGGWYLKGKIDASADTLNDLKQWVSDHDDAINQLHDDVLKLKEDQRLREAGQCK